MKRMYQKPSTETLRVETINAVLGLSIGTISTGGEKVPEGPTGDLP
ncbi:MAG: hypothetical protein MJZ92_03210 [Paludibacteraceae bacterium]|nr:hypothetical protein [Paludibacteraceae bacterium]